MTDMVLEDSGRSVDDRLAMSDSDSDSDMDDVDDAGLIEPTLDEALLQKLEDAVAANPLHYDAHVALIETLRAAERLDELKLARERMHALLPMGEDLWLAWIEDEKRTIASQKEIEAVHVLFSEATSDYLSIEIWKKYVEFSRVELADSVGSTGVIKEIEKVRAIMSKAMTAIGYHIPRSQEVWNEVRGFEEALLERENTEEQSARVRSMYQNRLAIPHSDIEETYSGFSSFVTRSNNENYEKVMVAAQQTYNVGLKKYQDRDLYERQLASSFESIESYNQYLEFELQQKKPEIFLTRTLFERAIAKHFANPELWIDYICFMVKHMNISSQVLSVCKRAVRNCPWSGDLWAQYMRVVELCLGTKEEVHAIFDQAINVGMLQSNFEEFFKVLVARVDHECWRFQGQCQSGRENSDLRTTMQQMVEMVKTVLPTGDPYYRLELRWIDLELNVMKNNDMARKLWKSLVQTHPGQSELYVRFSEFERQAGDHKKARAILRNAFNRNLDWPERICEAWMALERVAGSVETLQDVYALIRQKTKELVAKREKEVPASAECEMPKEAHNVEHKAPKGPEKNRTANAERRKNEGKGNKRKAEDNTEKGDAVVGQREKRARAHKGIHDEQIAISPPAAGQKEKVKVAADLTVSVENLDVHVTEKQIREFFEDVGRVTGVRFDPQSTAKETCHVYVEFENKEIAEAALAKNGELCGGKAAVVRSGKDAGDFRSLYVCNIPTTVDAKTFRKLFQEYGEVEQVRFSHRKTRRRFAYVQYTTEAGAQAALKLDGWEIEPGCKLSVAISNPELQKNRSPRKQQQRDPRNLHIANILKDMTVENLRELFSKHGDLKDIRLILNSKGNPMGCAIVEYETEDSAAAAIAELNDVDVGGRRMSITIAKPQDQNTDPKAQKNIKGTDKPVQNRAARRKNQRGDEKATHSVVIHKVPEGTSKEEIQELVGKSGMVRNVRWEPWGNHQQVVVEMENDVDAGNVVLHLNDTEYKGAILSVKNVLPPSEQLIPASLVPRKLQHRRIQGGSAATKKSSGKTIDQPKGDETKQDVEHVEVAEENKGSKTNDDFRKMLGLK